MRILLVKADTDVAILAAETVLAGEMVKDLFCLSQPQALSSGLV